MKTRGRKFVFCMKPISAAIVSVMIAGVAEAQDGSNGTDSGGFRGLEEVIVTARKREESLQDVPVAITAFGSDELRQADMIGIEDIALRSSGLHFEKQGGQTPGRIDSVLRFRGMSVNSTAPSRQVGSIFIDGIYVLGSAHSIPLDDIERVEVIKGPQAAYFGRNTFGGAVNYITNTPSLNEYSGRVSSKFSNKDDLEIAAAVEFPVVEDVLSARVGFRKFENGETYRATDGGALGEEQSEMLYFTLYAEPNEKSSIKFRAYYGEDNDGPAAGALIAGRQNDSCTGKVIRTPAGDTGFPQEYICGSVPGIGSAIPIMNEGRLVDSNTSLFPQRAATMGVPNILLDELVNAPLPSRLGSMPSLDRIGLVRELSRYSLAGNYDHTDELTSSFQVAYSELQQVNIRDYGPSAYENWFTREARSQDDLSVEWRLSYDNGGPLSIMGGVNWYQQNYYASANSGDVVALCIDTFSDGSDPADDVCNDILSLDHDVNNDEIETLGIFAAVNYRISEKVGVSVEARYQDDFNAQGVTRRIESNYYSFLPRVILQYTPTENSNIYASYSEGVLPGAVNQRLVDADANEIAQYRALFADAAGATDQEKIVSYEIGWKQSLFEDTVRFNVAAYYADWDEMKASVSAVIQETCRSSTTQGCRGPGQGEASIGMPATLADGSPFLSARGLTVAGASELYGLEVEGKWLINENWDAGFSYGYAESEYNDFIFIRVQRIAGFSDVAGYELPNYPKHSMSMNLSFNKPLANTDFDLFGRLDAFYVGKKYADESNLASCDAYTSANLRGGVRTNNFTVELYVTNLADHDNWTTCSRWTDFENPSVFPGITDRQGVAVSAPDPREFGLRFAYEF